MAKKDNQKLFREAYKKHYGNISKACEAAGIERATYYQWKNSETETDKKFFAELAAIEPDEKFLDFVEDKLSVQIRRGNITAIIFALKTKGKKRGYIERQEITGADGEAIKIQTIIQNVFTDKKPEQIENSDETKLLTE